MKPDEIAWLWIDAVEKIPAASFRSVENFASIPDPPAGDSLLWCGRIFVAAANPHSPFNAARHGFHLAEVDPSPEVDLLRHEYRAAGLELVVIEGVNFSLIEARPATPKARPAVDEVGHALLDLPVERNHTDKRDQRFRLPEPRKENALVSTNPELDPFAISDWTDRVDAVVRRGAVYLLCYKKKPGIVGFLSGGQWFTDDFRRDPTVAR